MDAAGKDGAIKHVMSGFNPQGVKVVKLQTSEQRGARSSISMATHDRAPFAWRDRYS